MEVDEPTILIRRVEADAVIDLRHRILRDGLPRETAMFDGDVDRATIHLGAFDAWDVMVGCVTIMRRLWQGQPAWQLRGMAVDHAQQGQGIGGQLLREVERVVLEEGFSRLLWCNARTPAVRFYEANGWRLASPEFEVPTAGPHHKMTRHLA